MAQKSESKHTMPNAIDKSIPVYSPLCEEYPLPLSPDFR